MYAYIKEELDTTHSHDDAYVHLADGGAMRRISLADAAAKQYTAATIYMEVDSGGIEAKPFELPRADLVWWYPPGEPMRFAPATVMLVPQLEAEESGIESDYDWIRRGC